MRVADSCFEVQNFRVRGSGVRKTGRVPLPKAILCISAHWETNGTQLTAMENPATIHDFGGFPHELYQVRYPAPGSSWLTGLLQSMSLNTKIGLNQTWGLDHGCWSVLKNMYPLADVPVVQLSLDYAKTPHAHYALGRELSALRSQVLILGSGNMVHNLHRLEVRGDFNQPFGFDWAIEANELFKKLITANRHEELINYPALGNAVQQAVPTPEHYLPMLYILALQGAGEQVTYFNDIPVAGSLTMTSFIIQ
jgi:4,5-DOPA dioxygenase extradiol